MLGNVKCKHFGIDSGMTLIPLYCNTMAHTHTEMYLKSALKKITNLQGAVNICGSRGIYEKVSKILTSAVYRSVANV